MGKSAPAPPDYRAAAQETAAGNLEMLNMQTRANRPDQYTPWGSSTWEEHGGTPGTWNPRTGRMEGGTEGGWTQTMTLSPEEQRSLDAQRGITTGRSELAAGMFDRVEDEFGGFMDWDQFGPQSDQLERGQYYADEAGDALYNRATSRLDPRWEQKNEALESKLRNQGLRPGDEAYDRAIQEQGFQETDAYNQAQWQATAGAGAEGGRFQGMDQNAINTNQTLRQQQIAEEMQQRGFTLNEINAILTGQQIGMPSMPGFNTAGVVQGADMTGAAQDTYSAEMDAFSADQAMAQSIMNAGAGAMSMSDIRVKHAIEYVTTILGRNLYRWVYNWGAQGFGVLAQENPDMVVGSVNGILVVDYRRI